MNHSTREKTFHIKIIYQLLHSILAISCQHSFQYDNPINTISSTQLALLQCVCQKSFISNTFRNGLKPLKYKHQRLSLNKLTIKQLIKCMHVQLLVVFFVIITWVVCQLCYLDPVYNHNHNPFEYGFSALKDRSHCSEYSSIAMQLLLYFSFWDSLAWVTSSNTFEKSWNLLSTALTKERVGHITQQLVITITATPNKYPVSYLQLR